MRAYESEYPIVMPQRRNRARSQFRFPFVDEATWPEAVASCGRYILPQDGAVVPDPQVRIMEPGRVVEMHRDRKRHTERYAKLPIVILLQLPDLRLPRSSILEMKGFA